MIKIHYKYLINYFFGFIDEINKIFFQLFDQKKELLSY